MEVMPIKLLLADVDGTLVTHDKVLTERAKAAVKKMRDAGIAFAITSGRPPRGMQMLIEPLSLTTPIAAFNGGLFVRPDLSVIEQRVLQKDVVEPVIAIIKAHKLDVWIYRGIDWFVRERHGPHVDREEWTVKFPPTVVSDFTGKMDDVAKIVGVSDDLEAVAKCEGGCARAIRERCSLGPIKPRARAASSSIGRAVAALLCRRDASRRKQGCGCGGRSRRCLAFRRSRSRRLVICLTIRQCLPRVASALPWDNQAMK